MEVCRVRMGQPAKAKLSGSQTTEMLNFAALRPHQNAELITQQGIDNLNLGSTNPTLSRFMLALANKEMITVPGRILTGPDVYYRAKKIAKTNGGSWNMRDIKVRTHILHFLLPLLTPLPSLLGPVSLVPDGQ